MNLKIGAVVFQSAVDELKEWMEGVAGKRAKLVAEAVRTRILKGMAGKKTGRRYRVPGTRHRWYTASAPGESPAIATGRLRQSIKTTYFSTGAGAAAVVGTNLVYGIYLELGTSRIRPRPWLLRGVRDAQPEIKKILEEPW